MALLNDERHPHDIGSVAADISHGAHHYHHY